MRQGAVKAYDRHSATRRENLASQSKRPTLAAALLCVTRNQGISLKKKEIKGSSSRLNADAVKHAMPLIKQKKNLGSSTDVVDSRLGDGERSNLWPCAGADSCV